MLDTLLKDFQLASRALYRTPSFALLVVLAFALGIGGTTTMFTAVNKAFLRPLPYPEEDRVVVVWQTRKENRQVRISMLDVLDWREQNQSFEHLSAMGAGSHNITSGNEPERVMVGYVTQDFFSVLGVPPMLGRTFTAEEAVSGGPRSVILGYNLWQRLFNGDPGILRSTLSMEGSPFHIVGVMPAGFAFPDNAECWLPLYRDDGSTRSAHNYRVLARLKRGVTLESAQTDMDAVAARLAQAYPESNAGYGVAVVPLRRELLGRTGKVLLVMLGAVSCVLLIACANVTNLLLARSIARHSEATLRLALGASKWALLRPFLAESVLFALLGGLLGLGLTLLGTRLISRLAPPTLVDPDGLQVDWRVLLFSFGISLAVGLLCGLIPALYASRQDLRTALAASGRSVLSGSGKRGMDLLIVTEVAITFALLVCAGLFLQSARRLEAIDPGFRVVGVSASTIAMGGTPGSRYDKPEWRVRFYGQLLERVQSMPGILEAGLVSQPPLSGKSYNGTLVVDDPDGESGPTAHYRLVGGSYFSTLRVPLLRGRTFSRDDRADTPKVALVNEMLSRQLLPLGDVIGQRVKMPGMDLVEEWATIVGVVGNVRHQGLGRDPVPEVYFPYEQRPGRTWEMSLVVRSQGDPAALGTRVREEVLALDRGLPVHFQTMTDLLSADLMQPRFRALLLGAFAGTALALAAIGIFGVVSYAVGRRNREVGIRMALGADRGAMQSLVLRGGMSPVVAGMVLGLLLSLAITRVLSSLLFEVSTTDPATFAAVAAALATIALAATYLPVRQIAEIEPSEALRAE